MVGAMVGSEVAGKFEALESPTKSSPPQAGKLKNANTSKVIGNSVEK